MRYKKIAEPPVCSYGSSEPTLASQLEWSVHTFKHGALLYHKYNLNPKAPSIQK
jgi:hypothetical protein